MFKGLLCVPEWRKYIILLKEQHKFEMLHIAILKLKNSKKGKILAKSRFAIFKWKCYYQIERK